MALITCPDCGNSVSDLARACLQCGRPINEAASTTAYASRPAPDAAAAEETLPLFPVATHKFIVLSIFSFGLYEVYWCYKNWKRLKEASGEELSPVWRAIFAPLWGFSLFRRMRDVASAAGVPVGWSPGVLATLYLVLNIAWRLPDPWWLLGFASLIPMLPVQQAAQQANARSAGVASEGRNGSYSAANIVLILLGGLIWILVVIGLFLPPV